MSAPMLQADTQQAARVLRADYNTLRQQLDRSVHRNGRPRAWVGAQPLLWWRAVLGGLIFRPRPQLLESGEWGRASAVAC